LAGVSFHESAAKKGIYWRETMNGLYWIAGITSVVILVYLLGALLYPEKFS
jgi:K+-transporting ATPase KdpF subunit